MIKISIKVIVAKTSSEKKLCYKIRHDVFIKETGYIENKIESDYETDVFDELISTVHFLAYYKGMPAGTVRLLVPNKQIAKTHNSYFGLSIEELFNIKYYTTCKLHIAEISRSSVKDSFRMTRTILYLWKALMDYALSKGITDLVTSVNPETDKLSDAFILYDHLKQKNFVDNKIVVVPKKPGIGKIRNFRFPLVSNSCCNYDCNEGEMVDIPLPPTIKLFTRVGSSFTGEPMYSEKIDMCAMPMNLQLQEVNRIFNSKFFRRENVSKEHH